MSSVARFLVQRRLQQMNKQPESTNGAAAGSQAPQSVLPVVKPPVVKPPGVKPNLVQQPVVQPAPPPTTEKRIKVGAGSAPTALKKKIKVGAGSAKPDRKKHLIKEALRIYHVKYPNRTFEQFRKEYLSFHKQHRLYKVNLKAGTCTKEQKPDHFWPIADIIASKDYKVKSHDYGPIRPDWCIENGFMKGSSSKKQKIFKVDLLDDDSSDGSSSPVKVDVKVKKEEKDKIDSDDSSDASDEE